LKSSSKVIADKLIVTLDHAHCYEVNATAFGWYLTNFFDQTVCFASGKSLNDWRHAVSPFMRGL
jgi:hypothetical protein